MNKHRLFFNEIDLYAEQNNISKGSDIISLSDTVCLIYKKSISVYKYRYADIEINSIHETPRHSLRQITYQ
jgi:hypothetical protein